MIKKKKQGRPRKLVKDLKLTNTIRMTKKNKANLQKQFGSVQKGIDAWLLGLYG